MFFAIRSRIRKKIWSNEISTWLSPMPHLERPHARHQKVDCGRCSCQEETRDLGWHNGFVFMIHVVFSRCSWASLRNIMKNPWNHRKEEKHDKIHRNFFTHALHSPCFLWQTGKQNHLVKNHGQHLGLWCSCSQLASFQTTHKFCCVG